MYMAATLEKQWLNFGEYAIMNPLCLCPQTYLDCPVVQVWYKTLCVSPFQSPCTYMHVLFLEPTISPQVKSDNLPQGSRLKESLGQWL